jgi:hypothetical protein
MMTAETNDKAAPGGEHVAHVALEKTSSKKGATQKKGAPKAKKTAKAAKPKKEANAGKQGTKPDRKAAARPRAESKGTKILEMIGRTKGATLAEIMKVTDWQPHSVRGFVSGTLIKKMGLKVESFLSNEKERTYRVK